MNKHLPLIVFLICIAIALILVFSFRPWWPAALAVAMAGAALALGLRNPNGVTDSSAYDYETEALREANATLRADLDETRAMIEDLADVVEQLASISTETYREEETNAATDQELLARLTALEAKLGSARLADDESGTGNDPESRAPQGASTGQLRSLMARVSRKETASGDDESELPSDADLPVRLSPVFAPTMGAPVSFIVSAEGGDDLDDLSGLFAQAARVADQLEAAGRDVTLFVRLSAKNLANDLVRNDVLRLIDDDAALRKRMTLMTPQAGFDAEAEQALATFAERGCKFALSDVRDWSLNLAALSRAGLAYIAVDGPAMARSAEEQGGDPRRLAEALALHGIALIAGGVTERAQIDAVRGLNPALVMGEGLGASRIVESLA